MNSKNEPTVTARGGVSLGCRFTPTGGPVHVPREHDARTAVRFAHPDGSIVVVAHQLAEPPGDDAEGLGLAAVGG